MAGISLDKRKTVLLIADFYANQMGVLPHPLSRQGVEKTQALLQAARAAGVLVCYSATVFRSNYIEISGRNKSRSQHRRSGQPSARTDAASQIHPAVAPIAGEPVIGKHRVNAFYGTD